GFSQNTCLPAFAAAMICSVCWVCGVHRTTASMFESLSTLSRPTTSSTPCSRAKSVLRYSRVSTAFETLSFLLRWIRGTMILPHQPIPTTATLNTAKSFQTGVRPLRRLLAAGERGVHRGHDFLGHELHRALRELRVDPVVARIDELAEV